jgi:acetyl esterase/lipase
MSLRKVVATLTLLGALGVPATASSSPTVLLLHGGGGLSGSAASMGPWTQDFRAHGVSAVAVDYPLGDVAAAQRYVDIVASRLPRPVVAYGVSAGATLSASLAARGRVAGAVNVVGPMNLATWDTPVARILTGMLPGLDRRATSPVMQLSPLAAPTLNQCGATDSWVPCSQAAEFTLAALRYQRDTGMSIMPGAHGQSPAGMWEARRWIERRFGR